MRADRIVVHSGSCGKITRIEALKLASDTLRRAVKAADENGYGNIRICPETMGKVNQLGNVEEVIKLCQIDERFLPTLDFGHINACLLYTSRTHVGCDNSCFIRHHIILSISIHAPLRGATCIAIIRLYRDFAFQSTHP